MTGALDRGRIAPTVAEEHDPFEDFNRSMGAGSVRTPYPQFAELRRQGPIVKIDMRQLMEAMLPSRSESSPNLTPPADIPVYMAVSHDAVSEVLRDSKTFSSQGYAATMGVVMGNTILQMDEPVHSQYRGLIQQAFTRRSLERWERDLVSPVVSRLIDAFVDRGRADLVRELTFPFPVNVIAGMIGLPEEDLPKFHRWAVELISVGFDWERGLAASKAMGDYFQVILDERRESPRDDLISVLAGAELDGQRLTDDEIFAFLRLLAPAGAETTYRSSSNLFFGLLSNPSQLEAVREDRSLVPQAVQEGLRWECPLLGIMRTATRDTEVCGVAIPEGATVSINIGAANRDPERYENPDVFDLFREQKANMAFAFGAHRCLGMHLAKTESEVVLNTVLDRLPDLRLDPAAEDVHVTGMIFRAPLALPVTFDPS